MSTDTTRHLKYSHHVASQCANGAKMMSYRLRCDVITSHRRLYDVILTSCARWDWTQEESAFARLTFHGLQG